MVYFLSDAHIGSWALNNPSVHEQQCVVLLNRLAADATEIWLLGDIFDFWFEYFWHKQEQFTAFLDTLKNITSSGIKVHYFTGNHDLWTFGRLQQRTGVVLHKQPLATVINGKRCFLAHGDGIGPSDILSHYPPAVQKKIRGFMRLRRIFHNPICQFFFRCVPPCWGDKFGYSWARSSRLKELKHPVPYKGEAQEELVLFAKEREQTEHFDYYIFGHRHIELDLMLPSAARVIVLGDMFKQWTYAAMTPKGELVLDNFLVNFEESE